MFLCEHILQSSVLHAAAVLPHVLHGVHGTQTGTHYDETSAKYKRRREVLSAHLETLARVPRCYSMTCGVHTNCRVASQGVPPVLQFLPQPPCVSLGARACRLRLKLSQQPSSLWTYLMPPMWPPLMHLRTNNHKKGQVMSSRCSTLFVA